MKTTGFIAWAFLCLIPLATVVFFFRWLWRGFEGLGKRSTGPMPMTIAGYISWALLSLVLLAAGVFCTVIAIHLWQHAKDYGNELLFVEEMQIHAVNAGLTALSFWICGILAGRVPLRAWRSRKRQKAIEREFIRESRT
jgi:hypothetical protein